VRELLAGLWHWQAPHPDWTPDERWPQVVSSHAIDDGVRLILIDPLSVPDELLGGNDLVLRIERLGAVISGDTLVGFGRGFGINETLRGGVTRQEVAARRRLLLDRPVEVVLSAHGTPTDRAALE
jgi:hypothetical protein